MILETIATVGGLILPPAFDFLKKKFIKGGDTPEATINSLATTKPEVLPQYISGYASFLKSKTEWFNRDVVGVPSKWVINLRASIRPIAVILAFSILGCDAGISTFELDPGTRSSFCFIVGNWFGTRMLPHG